jgi:hypothetical protein
VDTRALAMGGTADCSYQRPALSGPAGGDAHTTNSCMPSLMSLADKGKWDRCHAMLDRRKGNVHERGQVRSAFATRTRHTVTSTPLPLCMR